MNKFKTRNFKLILYPEDESHVEAVSRIMSDGYQFAIILHNEDVWEEEDPSFDPEKYILGEKKKEHWHVVLSFRNAIWSSSLADELGICENYLRPAHNLNDSLLYLVHMGFPNKYQYSTDLCLGPLKTKLESLLNDESESDRVERLIELIENTPQPTYLKLLKSACRAGLYGDFRRMGAFAVKMILEELSYETS